MPETCEGCKKPLIGFGLSPADRGRFDLLALVVAGQHIVYILSLENEPDVGYVVSENMLARVRACLAPENRRLQSP